MGVSGYYISKKALTSGALRLAIASGLEEAELTYPVHHSCRRYPSQTGVVSETISLTSE